MDLNWEMFKKSYWKKLNKWFMPYFLKCRRSVYLQLQQFKVICDETGIVTTYLFSNCLVLVGSRNRYERDLHKQITACFTIDYEYNYLITPSWWYITLNKVSVPLYFMNVVDRLHVKSNGIIYLDIKSGLWI